VARRVGRRRRRHELILWGFTAGLINKLFDYVGLTREWDTTVMQALPEHMLGLRKDEA
jgi:hypothetical protein